MCGIAGIYSEKIKIDYSLLQKMTDVIDHRGPDGQGHWISPDRQVGFGHRRLSIVDLSQNGHQPFHYLNRYTIVFNGEIYNYLELRSRLQAAGYQFGSATDTEVLLAMYDHKGESCLEDLDGMFAFAIWDDTEKTLFCARDRFGEKPFYYSYDGSSFVFASEIKQFWAAGFKKEVEQRRLDLYLNFGEINDPLDAGSTFYRGIKNLDAGHCITVSARAGMKIRRYWEIDTEQRFTGTFEEAAEEFYRILRDSVRIRLRSDVPVGSSLSGGLDSSSIVMLIDGMKENLPVQKTFSARFRNFPKDEGTFIEAVAGACNNLEVHYTWPGAEDFMANLDRVCHHQDEPFSSSSIAAQFSVMHLAAENGVTVLLDGQGADEYLGGYFSQYDVYFRQLFYHDRKKYQKEFDSFCELHERAPHENFFRGETLRMKAGRMSRKLLGKAMPVPADGLQQKLKYDTQASGLKDLLRYADRNSMAHSREVRLPFLSHHLVNFGFSLPDHFKLNKGWSKYVLRQAMTGLLPHSVCWRKDKIGYETPEKSWLNSPGISEVVQQAALAFKSLPARQADDKMRWRLLLASKYFLQ